MQVTLENYQELSEKTESKNFEEISTRITPEVIRLLHHAIGLATESGEILDQLKKHIFYGKPLDIINLEEECGDASWYLAGFANTLKTTLKNIFQKNHNKLFSRYGEKFSQNAAINRNLSREREILEETYIDEDRPY